MTAGYDWDKYANGVAFWFTGALITSAKMTAMTTNVHALFEYCFGATLGAGKIDWLAPGGGPQTKAINFNTDNDICSGVGSGQPQFAAAPNFLIVIAAYLDHAVTPVVYNYWNVMYWDSSTLTASGVTARYTGVSADDYWRLYWLAIGASTIS